MIRAVIVSMIVVCAVLNGVSQDENISSEKWYKVDTHSNSYLNNSLNQSRSEKYIDLFKKGLIDEYEFTALTIAIQRKYEIRTESTQNDIISNYLEKEGYISTMGIGDEVLKHLKKFGAYFVKDLLGASEDCNDKIRGCKEMVNYLRECESDFEGE